MNRRAITALTATLVASSTADQYVTVAALWLLAAHHVDPAVLGAVVACMGFASVVSAPFIGLLLDRRSAISLLVTDNVLRAMLLAAIVVIDQVATVSVPLVLVVVTLSGALSPLTYAGVRVVVPRHVERDGLVRANTIVAVGDQLPMLVGPALAGLVTAALPTWSALFVPVTLLITAAALVGYVGRVWRGSAPAPVPPPVKRATRPGAIGAIAGTPAVRALLLLTVAYYFAYGPLEPAIPLYAQHSLHTHAAGYGLLWAALGAGALIGLLVVPLLSRRPPGKMNALGAVVWGVVMLPLAWIHSLVLAVGLIFIGGVVWAPYGPLETSTIQRLTPSARHGSIFGIRRAAQVAASPAGAAVGGALLGVITPATVIALSAAACIAAGAAALTSRALRSVPSGSAPDVPEPYATSAFAQDG